MQNNTAQVLKWIGLSEGGYVNHPEDPGGATDRGITQRTYDNWNKIHGRPPKPVKGISKAEAEDILTEQYFAPVRFNDLPSGLDYAVADFSTNSGPSRAVKMLQKLVGVDDDGIMGPNTLGAIHGQNIQALVAKYCDNRLAWLKTLKTWATFGRGWGSRIEQVRSRAVDMAQGLPVATPIQVIETPSTGSVKAREDEVSNTSLAKTVLKEPATLITAIGGLLAGVAEGQGPIQYALSALVVIGAVVIGIRMLRKSA